MNAVAPSIIETDMVTQDLKVTPNIVPVGRFGAPEEVADAVVMVEHTQPSGTRAIEVRRAASPGQFVAYAGSDIACGEALLHAGTIIGSREIGMLAACGIPEVTVVRRPLVAVIPDGTGMDDALKPWAVASVT